MTTYGIPTATNMLHIPNVTSSNTLMTSLDAGNTSSSKLSATASDTVFIIPNISMVLDTPDVDNTESENNKIVKTKLSNNTIQATFIADDSEFFISNAMLEMTEEPHHQLSIQSSNFVRFKIVNNCAWRVSTCIRYTGYNNIYGGPKGWWGIEPGSSAYVADVFPSSSVFYYARNQVGDEWSGPNVAGVCFDVRGRRVCNWVEVVVGEYYKDYYNLILSYSTLKIVNAWFRISGGKVSNFAIDGRSVADVVQTWVVKDRINVPRVSFRSIFGDPAPGQVKLLAVRVSQNE